MSKRTTQRQPSERLYLLDGMALAYRAYFSFISRPLINSKGENTSAIYGFVSTLMKILDDDKPDHIAVVFDTKEPTFRHVMYEPYKATREKMPEDMSGQLDTLKDVVRAFNVPVIELPGYEADDIMGTLARMAEKVGIMTYLVTGDKDFMQLISPAIKIYKPGKQGDEWEVLDERAVMDKFGVPPDQVIDVLGLIGDKSDNVPGVPGIGEKTAIPLVQQYGTIETILQHVNDIPQKGVQQKLRDNQEKALLSKKLVTIDTNVPLSVDLHHLNAKQKDTALLISLFTKLEFRSLTKKLSESAAAGKVEVQPAPQERALTDISTDKHTYHTITSAKDFDAFAKKLAKAKMFVFDTETTSTDPLRAEMVGLSFALKSKEAWYIPVTDDIQQHPVNAGHIVHDGHRDLFSNIEQEITRPKHQAKKPSILQHDGLSLKKVITALSPIFSNDSVKKIGQNIKYDMLVLGTKGIEVNGSVFDTMVANYVLRPDGRHNMDDMAAEHLSYKTITFDDLTGTGKERKHIKDIELEKIAEYSAEDADITFRLYEILSEKISDQHGQSLCEAIEFPLIAVLAEIERTGVTLDTTYLSELSRELDRLLKRLIKTIYSHAEEEFNINSTQQLSKILFEKLKLSVVRKTKTGYSTDVGVLEILRSEHPIINELLEYRQLQKLKSTYVDALPALINPITGRLHTSFNQTVAATGRLSSSDPNLQNIPIRSEVGRSIRKAFIPGSSDMNMLSADYSQIELRVMAHISGDEGLSEAFRNKEDIHTTTAAKVFGVDNDQVTKDMRRKAKEVNFGIMYGIGPFGLSTRLDISQGEAKEIIGKYFERFPKVKQYINDTLELARKDGFVSTLSGRRRFLPDLKSKNFAVRSNAERQAINMPIQGTAADMIKLAMIAIHSELSKIPGMAHMLLQVHDELVFEVKKGKEEDLKKLVIRKMKNALPLSVPVEVEVGIGKNWLEAH